MNPPRIINREINEKRSYLRAKRDVLLTLSTGREICLNYEGLQNLYPDTGSDVEEGLFEVNANNQQLSRRINYK